MKTILTVLALTVAASALSACVIYTGGSPRRVIEERQTLVPAHRDASGAWVPEASR